MKRLIRRSSQGEDAQGMVEFALVLPLLLLLMFGLIEVGRMLFVYSMVSSSSREGARYGAAAGDAGGFMPHYEDCDGIRAAAQRIGRFAGVSDGDIAIEYDRLPDTNTYGNCGTSLDITDSDVSKVKLGDRVIVTVSHQFQPILPLVNLPSFPISSTTYRTIVKDVQIEGTPQPAAANSPTVDFVPTSQTVTEGDTTVNITVQLSAPTGTGVVVNYSVSGSATQGDDFTISPADQVTIAPGGDSATIQVTVKSDDLYEDLENIVITMGLVLGANPGDSQSVVFIENDDPEPEVHFELGSADYDEGIPSHTVEVVVDTATGVDISVPFSVDGASTATAVADFNLGGPNPLVIPAGSTSVSIPLNIVDDALDEEDVETVIINLGTPDHGTLGSPSQHVGSILDNDLPPKVYFAISEQYVAEPSDDDSDKVISVEVLLSDPSGREVIVPFGVTGGANNGQDFSIGATQVEFSPLQQSASIDVTIFNDEIENEGTESIILTLAEEPAINNTYARVSPFVHTLYITDITVSFAEADSTYDETAGAVSVFLEISSAPPTPVTVNLTVGGIATEGDDFTLSSNVVTFPTGSAASKAVTVTLIEDILDEYDETVILSIGSTTIAAPAQPDKHTLTITDNDEMPSVSFASSSQTVPESVGAATVNLQLSAVSGRDVIVPVNLSGTATRGADQDYTTDPSNMVITIPAGETSRTITLNVVDDPMDEDDTETIIAGIAPPTNAIVGGIPVHTVSITDTDVMPMVAFTIALQNGSEAVGTMSVGVRLSNPSARDVTVPFTVSGSATEDVDYFITLSPITIPAGEVLRNIDIDVIDDGEYESEENVLIDMGTPTNALQGALVESEARITDNDPVVCQGFYTFDELNVDPLRIRARLLNASQAEVMITGFALNWSDSSAGLSAISLESVNIWNSGQPVPPPAIVNSGWTGSENNRKIGANSTGALVFDFTGTNLGALDFLFVYLDNGCTVSHTP